MSIIYKIASHWVANSEMERKLNRDSEEHRARIVDTLKDRYERFFNKHQEILVVYLFGSRAKGREFERSDIDLGFLIKENMLSQKKDFRYGN